MKLSEMTGLQAFEELLKNDFTPHSEETLINLACHFGGKLSELSGECKAIMRENLFDQKPNIKDNQPILVQHYNEARQACQA